MHETLGELSHILLSPLLAVAIWFIISQGETYSNVFILSAVSFAVGLVTEEVVHAIVNFATGRLKLRDREDLPIDSNR
jgi:hypothetical protein